MRVGRRSKIRARLVPGYKTWGWRRVVVKLGAARIERGVALDAEFYLWHAGAAQRTREMLFLGEALASVV